jgi:hypothetical protein
MYALYEDIKYYDFGAGIKWLVGAADQNLNDRCIRKANKCGHLNLVVGILSISMHDRYM